MKLISTILGWFKKKPVVEETDYKARISDIEDIVTIQAQIITDHIERIKEVRKFREQYVEDLRIFANAISNIDKRVFELEKLVSHLDHQIAELEQEVDIEDDEESEITSSYKKDLN